MVSCKFLILCHPALKSVYGEETIKELMADTKDMLAVSIGKYANMHNYKTYKDFEDIDDFFDYVEDSICLLPLVDDYAESLNITLSLTQYQNETVLFISYDSYAMSVGERLLKANAHYAMFDRQNLLH